MKNHKSIILGLFFILFIIIILTLLNQDNSVNTNNINPNRITSIEINNDPIGKINSEYRFKITNYPVLKLSINSGYYYDFDSKLFNNITTNKEDVLQGITELFNENNIFNLDGSLTYNNERTSYNYIKTEITITLDNGMQKSINFRNINDSDGKQSDELLSANKFFDQIVELLSAYDSEIIYSEQIKVETFVMDRVDNSEEVLNFLDTMGHDEVKTIEDLDYSIQKKLSETANFKDSTGRQFVVYYVPVIE